MRLSLRMIANQLEGLDYSIQVRPGLEPTLRSARLVYAPNCVQLVQENQNVRCIAEGDHILIREIDLKYAFELVQGIFDQYNDWYASTIELSRKNDWRQAINELGFLIRNPIVFFDANNRVVAMCSSYFDTYVDQEWEYLKTHHYSSYQMTRDARQDCEGNWTFLRFQKPSYMKYGSMAHRVEANGVTYGFVSVLEVAREFNDGDVALLKTFVQLIATPFSVFCEANVETPGTDCFRKLMLDQYVDDDILQQRMRYFRMESSAQYQVYVIEASAEDSGFDLQATRKFLLYNCEALPLVDLDDRVVAIAKIQDGIAEKLEHTLHELRSSSSFQAAVSTVCDNIRTLSHYYRQALYALKFPANQDGYLHHFSAHAVEFLMGSSDPAAMLCASHPGIRRICRDHPAQAEDWCRSLEVYLLHGCSLLPSARQLFPA